MDVQTVDENYQQLHSQADQTTQAVTVLAQKLQTAAQGGDQSAREWQLDLREIALGIQQEQNQVALLLQAIHGFVAEHSEQAGPPQNTYQQPPQQPVAYPQPGYGGQQPGYGGAQPGYGGAQSGYGGAVRNFLTGGFGRAIAQGAAFGIGDDLINHLFR